MNTEPSGSSTGQKRSNSPAYIPPWKRVLDISGCVVALPIFGVVTVFVAVLTRLTSRGPVFFRQERVGIHGARFSLYKFRTMHVSSEVTSHQAHFAALVRSNTPMQKLDARGDSRLMAGGRWLRASGLDELPQIINVLRGEMSLVGPRPCIPYEYAQYSTEHKKRCACAPGLTGLWQVSGKNRTTFEEMVRLDVAYADRQSPWLDLKILFLTLPTVCSQIADLRTTWTRSGAKSGTETTRTTSISPNPVTDSFAVEMPRAADGSANSAAVNVHTNP
jgi:lipopolysaccharide/colanic/teichoic acid biosynthesis glycosyltransferase